MIGFLDFSPYINGTFDYNGYPRQWAGLFPEVTIEEDADDTLRITDHPVEQGALISDHAFKLPAEVRVTCGWSAAGAALAGTDPTSLYNQILTIQIQRQPFLLITGKRFYPSMLIAVLRNQTNAQYEYTLFLEILFRQILLSSVTTIDASAMQQPQATAPTISQGQVQTQPTNVDLSTASNPANFASSSNIWGTGTWGNMIW
jgi:hypothetical protein